MGNYSTLVMIALMVGAFYLLILRPQKKRQQAIQRTLSSLGPGDRVLLGSGLFGTLVSVGDRQAVLEISPGVELTVLKQAIVRTVTEADEDEDDPAEELDGDLHDEVGADVDPAPLDRPGGASQLGGPGQDVPATDRTTPSAESDRTTPSAGADPNRPR